MRPAGVVEGQVGAQTGLGGRDRIVGFQIHIFVLDVLPRPLDEDVVAPAALAVHADLNAMLIEHSGELAAGELAAFG